MVYLLYIYTNFIQAKDVFFRNLEYLWKYQPLFFIGPRDLPYLSSSGFSPNGNT